MFLCSCERKDGLFNIITGSYSVEGEAMLLLFSQFPVTLDSFKLLLRCIEPLMLDLSIYVRCITFGCTLGPGNQKPSLYVDSSLLLALKP